MQTTNIPKIKLEDFDTLFIGHPDEIEKNLKSLLPQAKALKDKSIYLQILSQIALAQAMQSKFSLAHKTLNKSEEFLISKYFLAKARILLERGRVFHQSNDIESAIPFFKKSYFICEKHKLDFHTANAAHMIAIVIKNSANKIKWNKIAIDLAKKTKDTRAHAWLGALYNNLAQNYLESKQYKKAHATFKLSQKYGEERGDIIIVLGAKWGVARALRSLNSFEEALKQQSELLEEQIRISKQGILPKEILTMFHGLIFEELAELHFQKVKEYSAIAFNELSKDSWFVRLGKIRLSRMKKLSALM